MRTDRSAVIGLALLCDALFGDPPNRFHPVAWMGSAIAAAKSHAPKQGNGWSFAYGAALDVAGICLTAGVGRFSFQSAQ